MKNGFTLVELLVVIGIVIFLAALVLPVSYNFYQIQLLNKTTDSVVWLLRQAQSQALAQKNSSSFGLYFADQQITLFQGEDYQNRQTEFDIVLSLPGSVKVSGLEQIIFSRGTGLPNLSGAINLLSGQGERIVQISSLGVINY